eukprot:4043177-Amphidinium_carterae.1
MITKTVQTGCPEANRRKASTTTEDVDAGLHWTPGASTTSQGFPGEAAQTPKSTCSKGQRVI